MNSDQKLQKRYQEQRRDSLHPHQTKIWKDIIMLFSKKYLMKKKFLVMKVNPQQWKKILAGATFVQIFLSNQLLKEQNTKTCSIADKNKVLTKNGSFAVPSLVASRVLHRSHLWADIKPPKVRKSSCKRFASIVAEDSFQTQKPSNHLWYVATGKNYFYSYLTVWWFA